MTKEAKILIAIAGVTIFIVGIVFFLSAKTTTAPVQSQSNQDLRLLLNENSHKTASDSANLKVTIVEFGDYQCPACGVAYPVTKQVLQDYSGKINFVFRNFPLPQHQNAQISAEAAEAAGAQGKYWQMHDLLYEKQSEWSGSLKPLDLFAGYAQSIGLDVTKFQKDVTANKFSDMITQDKNDGLELGVNSTPTFYINGKKMSSFDYPDFKTAIEASFK